MPYKIKYITSVIHIYNPALTLNGITVNDACKDAPIYMAFPNNALYRMAYERGCTLRGLVKK
jgi:hypothetical protein